MTFSLLWLPDVLRAAGLVVQEVPGWQNRGHGDEGKVLGVLCHHTCGPLHGDAPALNVVKDGRPDLEGPLAQLVLGRSGVFYVVAAGKCWHAGRGNWLGVKDGNSHFIGVEAENTGETRGPRADHWPDAQMDAYARGCAAILKHIGAESAMCAGHKEYALPTGRKDDPNFDMGAFRARVARIMGEMPATPPPAKPAPRVGTVTTNDLALRKSPSAKSELVRRLKKGDKVTITDDKMNDVTKWYGVEGGYVAANYVTINKGEK